MPFLLALVPLRAVAAGVFGWAFADWRRITALCGVLAVVSAYVVGDVRGRHAEAAAWQARYDKLSHDFITAADAAKAAETKRQADIGSNVTKAFQDELAARDAADAKTRAELEKEIAAYQSKPGGACTIDAGAYRWLLDAKP